MRHKRGYLLISVFAVGTVFAVAISPEILFSENGVLSRFSTISTGLSADNATLGRIIAFQGAFDQFLSSPLWGSSIEEKITGFYPHNVILEALMATGIVGGLPFIAFTLWALVCAWRLARNASRHLWIGILAAQYFFGSMLSGSIYTSNTMWVLAALVLSHSLNQGQLSNSRSAQSVSD
jgi:O-antigen ligase